MREAKIVRERLIMGGADDKPDLALDVVFFEEEDGNGDTLIEVIVGAVTIGWLRKLSKPQPDGRWQFQAPCRDWDGRLRYYEDDWRFTYSKRKAVAKMLGYSRADPVSKADAATVDRELEEELAARCDLRTKTEWLVEHDLGVN